MDASLMIFSDIYHAIYAIARHDQSPLGKYPGTENPTRQLFNKSVGLKFAGEIRKVDICLIDGESLGTVPVVRQFVSSGACER